MKVTLLTYDPIPVGRCSRQAVRNHARNQNDQNHTERKATKRARRTLLHAQPRKVCPNHHGEPRLGRLPSTTPAEHVCPAPPVRPFCRTPPQPIDRTRRNNGAQHRRRDNTRHLPIPTATGTQHIAPTSGRDRRIGFPAPSAASASAAYHGHRRYGGSRAAYASAGGWGCRRLGRIPERSIHGCEESGVW